MQHFDICMYILSYHTKAIYLHLEIAIMSACIKWGISSHNAIIKKEVKHISSNNSPTFLYMIIYKRIFITLKKKSFVPNKLKARLQQSLCSYEIQVSIWHWCPLVVKINYDKEMILVAFIIGILFLRLHLWTICCTHSNRRSNRQNISFNRLNDITFPSA